MCAPTGVWLLGPLGAVGLQNNVLTLFCSAQSCRSRYTFKPPDRTALGGYDSGGGAAGLQAPNRVDASVLVLLLSAKVPRGGTSPGLWGCSSQCLSASADKAAKQHHLNGFLSVIGTRTRALWLICALKRPSFNETSHIAAAVSALPRFSPSAPVSASPSVLPPVRPAQQSTCGGVCRANTNTSPPAEPLGAAASDASSVCPDRGPADAGSLDSV